MAIAAHKLPMTLVTPAKWKSYLGLNKDKGLSRSLASQRWPAQADLFKRVKDDGRSEACLLALFGKLTA
jgi:crossover junction endodeoxyribonuclease RuvC